MSKSLALVDSSPHQSHQGIQETFSNCKSTSLCQLSEEERARLELERSQSAAYLEQLTILEESMQNEHSEMIPFWERLLTCEEAIATLEASIQRLDQSLSVHRTRLEQLNLGLLTVNKQFIVSRREWDARGCGARGQIVE